MIYITGDLHGGSYAEKLERYASPELYELTRDDYLIVAGDFGLPWPGADYSDENCAWLESRPWTTLFIDGNHEHYPFLDGLATESFFGGRASRLPDFPHLIHLKRGEVYDLPNESGSSRVFCMGGAESVVDRRWRQEGWDWWPQELPDEDELAHGEESLARVGWKVDYVVTHCASSRMQYHALWPSAASVAPQPNRLTAWLDMLEDKLGFDYWYMGHYHKDTGLDEAHGVIFDMVVPLGAALPGNVEEEWR